MAEHELQTLQDQITAEVNGDAPKLAAELFGTKRNMPDMGTASDAEALQMMRQAYLRQDRTWLQGEARRDPQQFLDLSNKLGVMLPPTGPPMASPPA